MGNGQRKRHAPLYNVANIPLDSVQFQEVVLLRTVRILHQDVYAVPHTDRRPQKGRIQHWQKVK